MGGNQKTDEVNNTPKDSSSVDMIHATRETFSTSDEGEQIEASGENFHHLNEKMRILSRNVESFHLEIETFKIEQLKSVDKFKELVDQRIASIRSDPTIFPPMKEARAKNSKSEMATPNLNGVSILKDVIPNSPRSMKKVRFQDLDKTDVVQPVTDMPIHSQRNPDVEEFESGEDQETAESAKKEYDFLIEEVVAGKWRHLMKDSTNINKFFCVARNNDLKHEVHFKDLKFVINNNRFTTFCGENDEWMIQDSKVYRESPIGKATCYFIEDNCLKTIQYRYGGSVEKTSRYILNDQLIVETWLETKKEKKIRCVRRFERME